MKRRVWLLVALVVAVLVGSAAAAYFLLAGPRAAADGRQRDRAGVPVRVGELTTNLADAGARRLIRVEVELEVRDRKAARRVEERMTGVRDAVLQVLRARTFEQATAPDAMEALRKDVREAVNRFLGAEDVEDVFFGDFIVQ